METYGKNWLGKIHRKSNFMCCSNSSHWLYHLLKKQTARGGGLGRGRAWQAYREILEAADGSEAVVYARFVDGPPTILQYWYLYIYNDFDNNHEGD